MNLNNISPGTLFLVDALGALFSAIMLGILLARFEEFFGVPENLLYILAAIAFAFFLNSLSCFLFNRKNWQPWMRGIAVANALYCVLTAILLVVLHEAITVWGLLYFLVEMLIVLVLARMEWIFAKIKS